IVRGPPRKPRQRGHAIWIGNLPPQADLMSLVHHVCKETEGLESLFLISKSNCAFANYRDEQSCLAAQRKLHESRFMGVRLVSRLRKSTVEGPAGVTAPTGPAASAPQTGGLQEASTSGGGDGDESREKKGTPSPTPTAASFSARPGSTASVNGVPPAYKDRFFVLKSLTVEDLELSVRTRTWATQSHNEDKLNTAFKTSDNVYLVFSANKSGEYFGYARMVSAINEDPAAAIQFAPSAHAVSEVDLPKTIPTEATEFAPRGRIIDDSARGPIFWEVDRDHDDDDDNNNDAGTDENNGSGGQDGAEGEATGDAGSVRSGHDSGGSNASEPKAWGKPFEVEWLSTARLPFYRTRGLRNPWNSNREVKIARDGTELEPSVGRRLIGLFNRAQSPPVPAMPPPLPPSMVHGMAPPFGVRMQGPLPVGYPPLR
ncbi:YT521-B-like domain-containing protein, partial [Corynascus novoguineensis]